MKLFRAERVKTSLANQTPRTKKGCGFRAEGGGSQTTVLSVPCDRRSPEANHRAGGVVSLCVHAMDPGSHSRGLEPHGAHLPHTLHPERALGPQLLRLQVRIISRLTER